MDERCLPEDFGAGWIEGDAVIAIAVWTGFSFYQRVLLKVSTVASWTYIRTAIVRETNPMSHRTDLKWCCMRITISNPRQR